MKKLNLLFSYRILRVFGLIGVLAQMYKWFIDDLDLTAKSINSHICVCNICYTTKNTSRNTKCSVKQIKKQKRCLVPIIKHRFNLLYDLYFCRGSRYVRPRLSN